MVTWLKEADVAIIEINLRERTICLCDETGTVIRSNKSTPTGDVKYAGSSPIGLLIRAFVKLMLSAAEWKKNL